MESEFIGSTRVMFMPGNGPMGSARGVASTIVRMGVLTVESLSGASSMGLGITISGELTTLQ